MPLKAPWHSPRNGSLAGRGVDARFLSGPQLGTGRRLSVRRARVTPDSTKGILFTGPYTQTNRYVNLALARLVLTRETLGAANANYWEFLPAISPGSRRFKREVQPRKLINLCTTISDSAIPTRP